MDIEYWNSRWHENRIGFDLGGMHPLLIRYWKEVMGQPKKILVPMCGKAQCMVFFKNLGVETHAVEINQHAIESFFAETGLQAQIQKNNAEQVYRCQNLFVHCTDFFTYANDFDAVYDRAALIALPKHMRDDYLAKIAELLRDNGEVFLIALEHNSEKSPPFSLTAEDVYSECKRYFEVEHVLSNKEKNVPGGEGYEHLFKLKKRLNFNPISAQ